MRYMVLRISSKSEGGTGGYEAHSHVFTTFVEAEEKRCSISPSRRPLTVAVLSPSDSEDLWYNEHGAEFLYLREYESPGAGTCVQLLDQNGCEVGIPKALFVKHFHQARTR